MSVSGPMKEAVSGPIETKYHRLMHCVELSWMCPKRGDALQKATSGTSAEKKG